jgi:hypothetical protein
MRTTPLDDLRQRDGVPAVVVVAGASMAPGLPVGARVRVAAGDRPLSVGDVVVLRAGALGADSAEFVVHRLVGLGRGLVLHRGDAGGRVGIAPSSALVGRVVARLDAFEAGVPALADLAPPQRRAFGRAAARARVYLRLRALARVLRAVVPCSLGSLGSLARRLILGA